MEENLFNYKIAYYNQKDCKKIQNFFMSIPYYLKMLNVEKEIIIDLDRRMDKMGKNLVSFENYDIFIEFRFYVSMMLKKYEKANIYARTFKRITISQKDPLKKEEFQNRVETMIQAFRIANKKLIEEGSIEEHLRYYINPSVFREEQRKRIKLRITK